MTKASQASYFNDTRVETILVPFDSPFSY